MKSHWSMHALVTVSAALASWSAVAAEISDRAGKVDLSLQLSDYSSETINGEQGSRASLKTDLGTGFNFAYNVDNHWAFGLDFSWRSSDYSVTTTPDIGNPGPSFERSGKLDTSTTALTGTYHFSPARFTPLVTGSIGRTWIDTNVPAGPPVVACWWDPWWGQYCGPTVPTKSDVYWSYGLGLGVRWDSTGPFFLRGLVSQQWIDVGGNVGTPTVTQFRVDIGARF